MYAILIHGMGRSPLSMVYLALRLRAAGVKPYFFTYSATVEHWVPCVERLQAFIAKRTAGHDFIIIGHSLGTVLTRAVLPTLMHLPKACFFLAPPTQACLLARKLAPYWVYRWLTGEMGERLADPVFMTTLPVPSIPTKIYAGNYGLRGRYSPFRGQPNDGILMVDETILPDIPRLTASVTHTFIMMNRSIADDIVGITTAVSIRQAIFSTNSRDTL